MSGSADAARASQALGAASAHPRRSRARLTQQGAAAHCTPAPGRSQRRSAARARPLRGRGRPVSAAGRWRGSAILPGRGGAPHSALLGLGDRGGGREPSSGGASARRPRVTRSVLHRSPARAGGSASACAGCGVRRLGGRPGACCTAGIGRCQRGRSNGFRVAAGLRPGGSAPCRRTGKPLNAACDSGAPHCPAVTPRRTHAAT